MFVFEAANTYRLSAVHIANAFKEGEVDKENCLHILQTNTKGRPEVVDNLEVVTSVLPRRFPDVFVFQLTKDDFANLRCQNVTSNMVSRVDTSVLMSQIVTSKRGGLHYCLYDLLNMGSRHLGGPPGQRASCALRQRRERNQTGSFSCQFLKILRRRAGNFGMAKVAKQV